MAAKQKTPGGGLAMGMALRKAENVEGWLKSIHHELKLSRLFQTQRRYYVLPVGGQCKVGETQFALEPIAAGQTFIIDRLTCVAPAGAKLALYENSVQPSNFLETVPAPQLYAAAIAGTLPIEGPSSILAVVTGATEVGPFNLTLSGLIVPTQPRDVAHPRTSVQQ